jgi:hypothetical protein
MNQTLVISDKLYTRLQRAAYQRGFESIEQLLETWENTEAQIQQRRQVVQQIDQLREVMFSTYGEMPDGTELIREDRDR